MAVLLSTVHEPATLANIEESLDHEYSARNETEQLLADLKDKEAVAREMLVILWGVRGRDARSDRKAALKVLAKVKQKRVLAEQSLRRTQNRLKYLEAQSARDSRANIKNAQDRRMIYAAATQVAA